LRPPPRAVKQVAGFRVPADEMIGVSVPRKARSGKNTCRLSNYVLI
jgi:hypothetical protein